MQELENLVFIQREELLRVENELIDARREVADRAAEENHELEMLRLRFKNL